MLRTKATIAIAALAAGISLSPAHAETTLTLWSHWADEQSKVAFVEEAAKRLEAKHPDVKVKITWYQKGPLNTALQSALRARKGPDIFYADPFQTEYIENGLIEPLDHLLKTDNIEDWAKKAWTHDGKLYALPLEAQTVELYYNKTLLKRYGVELPTGAHLDTAKFLDLVKKIRADNITPIVVGVGDRDFPGGYLFGELLLKKLGPADYNKLVTGKLSYKDPRVVEVFSYIRQLADAGAFPKSFTSLKLGESHAYFYSNPGGAFLPMGSFYAGRAFNPPEKGGQPDGFPLGLMNYPVLPDSACPDCKTNRVGGSYVINAASKHKDLAAALLNEMTTPDMAGLWVSTALVQTGVKVDMSKLTTKYARYFSDLATANAGTKAYSGMLLDLLQGACLDAYKQVMNTGLPAGLVSVDAAISTMESACRG
jgi:multiple sugar transport system substrate-binding protein